MSETTEPGPAPDAPAPDERFFYRRPLWGRLYAYVLGPLLVGAIAVAIVTTTRLATHEPDAPAELVARMRSAGEHERWQAAFAFTRYLQRRNDAGETLDDARALTPELLELFERRAQSEPMMRRYLALAFGLLGDRRASPALGRALSDDDVETVVNSLAALGLLADVAMAPHVVAASRHSRAEVRAVAVFTLGVLGSEEGLSRLREATSDSEPSVRWNAAFALARQKDSAGEEIIAEILDRGPLYATPTLSSAQRREQFLNAVRAAGMVRTPTLVQRLETIARSDAEMEARNEARRLLEEVTTGQP